MTGAKNRTRRSIRLPGYDYSQPGAYFVTLVAAGRQCLFGEIAGGEVRRSRFGEIVRAEWMRTPEIRSEVELGTFIVMPNHLHGIVVISADAPVGATGRSPLRPRGPSPRSLGALIAGFKSSVTKEINLLRSTPNAPVWQRNYYERVIRDDKEWERIHSYILANPVMWEGDEENPAL